MVVVEGKLGRRDEGSGSKVVSGRVILGQTPITPISDPNK